MMKTFVISGVAVGVAGVLFVSGIFSAATFATMAGFCLWTPAVFMLGFGAAGLLKGKRLMLVNSSQPFPAEKTAHSEPVPPRRVKPLQNAERTM